jgi:four helix bundle protein
MGKNHRKLDVFKQADALTLAIYQHTKAWPEPERHGLQLQLRKAAVSVACHIVEGCARRSSKGMHHYYRSARGAATEAQYLVELAGKMNLLDEGTIQELSQGYGELADQLYKESKH